MDKLCPICGDKAPAGFFTCGRSRCQEASCAANRARNLRPGKRRDAAMKAAQDLAREADMRSTQERRSGG